MKEIIKKIIEFREERNWEKFHSPENLSKSISIESAELLECFQWGEDFDLEEVKEELADIMNYCLLLSHTLDLDVEEIILEKLEKNKQKYPVELSKGKSTKYNKL